MTVKRLLFYLFFIFIVPTAITVGSFQRAMVNDVIFKNIYVFNIIPVNIWIVFWALVHILFIAYFISEWRS